MRAIIAVLLAASASPWQVAQVVHSPGDDVFADVAVTADGTVWAAGHRSVNGRRQGFVQSLKGKVRKTLPGRLPELSAVTASASRVWAFGPNRAYAWNGRAWTSWSLGTFLAADAETVSAREVWAVGGNTSRRWTGSSWKRHPVPGTAQAVDAGGGQVWAAGSGVFQWSGKAWRKVPLPAIPLPTEDATATFIDVAVVSARNVWAVGGVTWEGADAEGDDVTFTRPLAMHWNGSRWRMSLGAAQGQPYTEAEPDGKGGVWIAQGGWNPRFWQVRGTSWESTPLPRPKGYDASLAAVARRPGTSQVWGAGFTSPEGDPDDPGANATLWRVS
ncbi:hypothetical protein GT755_34945 [Herbidospora sp. NEAU-GS84]|uniref:Uncharacterized protein n=1 Tax=Herbidospora solisilvae TaxID=2696284 RepID=A0A7C9NBU9_9ACTN|nr:hypothetical protein [Herbidospora solisilvae]NAS26853.1 hypothetical protein [Herbidospora solisilvae]